MVTVPGASYSGPLKPLGAEERLLADNLRRHVTAVAGRAHNVWNLPALEASAQYIDRTLAGLGYAVSGITSHALLPEGEGNLDLPSPSWKGVGGEDRTPIRSESDQAAGRHAMRLMTKQCRQSTLTRETAKSHVRDTKGLYLLQGHITSSGPRRSAFTRREYRLAVRSIWRATCGSGVSTSTMKRNPRTTRRGRSGGLWKVNHVGARCTERDRDLPDFRDSRFGFRLCCLPSIK